MYFILFKNVMLHNLKSYYRIVSTFANDVYEQRAITASCELCAKLGNNILEQGGSVADCAISVLLCAGIRNPERMGVGGGFVLTIYSKSKRQVEVLIARERAPSASRPEMFTAKTVKGTDSPSVFGGLAVAVPGALQGYWALHKRYGRLPWKRLVQPAIELCYDGVSVEPFTKFGLQQLEDDIIHSKTLRQILVDPFSGRTKTEKHKIYRKTLGKTLERIAEYGPNVLYNGELTENFVKDIGNEGGIITAADLANYSVEWMKPLSLKLVNDLRVFCPPPPSSGPVLLFILKCVLADKHLYSYSVLEKWSRIAETWKHAYGLRSRLGDPKFVPHIEESVRIALEDSYVKNTCQSIVEYLPNTSLDPKFYGANFDVPSDSGTSHFNFVSAEGDVIAVTETINTLFGAMFRSASTGIILNNTMGDFSIPGTKNVFNVPASQANGISPGKIPLTSMLPTIVLDEHFDLRLVIGGAGGTKIISAVSLVLLQHLLLGVDINTAVDSLRLHHQLQPMELQYETDFPEDLLDGLKHRGHLITRMKRGSVVSLVSKDPNDGLLHAKGDWRRKCANAGV